MTKDEKFLLELLKESKVERNRKQGINPVQVGTRLGFTDKQTKTILRWLFQANIVKWLDGEHIYLTSHGETVARSLIE